MERKVPQDESKQNPELCEALITRAYELTDPTTGRRWHSLISSHRLKAYHDRELFDERYPPTSEQNMEQSTSTDREISQPLKYSEKNQNQEKDMKNKVETIVKKCCKNGKIQYLVRYPNKEMKWMDTKEVNPTTLQKYNMKLRDIRRRKQTAARKNFTDGYKAEQNRSRYKAKVR